MRKRIEASLRGMWERGRLVSSEGSGRGMRWTVVGDEVKLAEL
jgi:hypothetical protein